ncbi:transcriptional regulator [Fictibacillus macauensis ZFHKF-1]|uniref:HTH-type transcriptional regulatory protein TyrR n=1 Tax=Fictibacillus macauensis ZFHKF-1 TaxID=1196324 RepID=I8J6P1_9BACL|nr:transcriptional regulator [Fictibacillus macauensis ZFHKF-1]
MRELLEREIEGIINASGENIMMTDGRGVILRSVKNGQEVYGLASSELVGKSVQELEALHIFNPSVTLRVIEEKKPITVMQQTATGKTMMTRGVPLLDEHHNVIRVISFSHDMTEIQQLKEKYEAMQQKMMHYESEIEQLRDQHGLPHGVVIKSKAMQDVWTLIRKVAGSSATVVLQGESGVGKSIFARAIHHHSTRRDGPLIEVNCGAIPESLVESELFGYEPGAFTGAHSKGKVGLLELANKGTLFLDEIGELPLSIQVKLLKVLQEKTFVRVGGTKSRSVDFRLITASHRDLKEMVADGTFREDLYYRLHVVPLLIPPLRERPDDIVQLTHAFLAVFNERYHTNKHMHPLALQQLLHYAWPGNVRELENMIERLVVTVESEQIQQEHIPFLSNEQHVPATTLQEALADVERKWLIQARTQCQSTYEMARYLGMSQPTVIRRLQKYKIDSKMN